MNDENINNNIDIAKLNIKNNKNKMYNNINKNTKKAKASLLINDENEMDELNEQYDLYINDLREKLSSIKEERKKTENDYNIIRHRLALLKNQEKINYMNYQNIRFQLKEMKKNRIESQKRIQRNLGKK